MGKPAAAEPRCATCACFVPRTFASKEIRAAAANAGLDTESGECRYSPRFEKRQESDWCSKHRPKRKST
jgi:hypothetical protein